MVSRAVVCQSILKRIGFERQHEKRHPKKLEIMVVALKREKKKGNGSQWHQFRKEPSLKLSGTIAWREVVAQCI